MAKPMKITSYETLAKDYEELDGDTRKLAEKYNCTVCCMHIHLDKAGIRKMLPKKIGVTPDMEFEGWEDDEIERIAEAVIGLAIKDYRYALSHNQKMKIEELEGFFNSNMFTMYCSIVSDKDLDTRLKEYLCID